MKTAGEFGAYYWEKGEQAIHKSGEGELYVYTAYIGEHRFNVEHGDCVFRVDMAGDEAELLDTTDCGDA